MNARKVIRVLLSFIALGLVVFVLAAWIIIPLSRHYFNVNWLYPAALGIGLASGLIAWLIQRISKQT